MRFITAMGITIDTMIIRVVVIPSICPRKKISIDSRSKSKINKPMNERNAVV
jgi:hypothetical protein